MLYDDFQSDVEDRARKAGVKVGGGGGGGGGVGGCRAGVLASLNTQSQSSPRLPALPAPPPALQVRLSKQLTELEKQFYGSSMAYDRALQDGKEPLDQVRGWGSGGQGRAQELVHTNSVAPRPPPF